MCTDLLLLLLWKNIHGDYILLSATLSNIHWFLLLKFAKAHAAIHPTGKVR